jgi:hypothetical protein
MSGPCPSTVKQTNISIKISGLRPFKNLYLSTWFFLLGSWLLATCPAKRELLARIRNQKNSKFYNQHPILHFSFFFFHSSPLGSFYFFLGSFYLAFGG